MAIPAIEAEISGYLQNLKGDKEEQLDVPAFLRRAHILSACTDYSDFCSCQQKQQQPVKPQFHNSWTR